VRYAFSRNDSLSTSSGLPGTQQILPRSFHSPAIQAVYALTSTQTLEVRGGALRGTWDNRSPNGLDPAFAALGVPEFGIGFTLTGTTSFTLPNIVPYILLDNQTTGQVAALYTWTRGRLTLRLGSDVKRIHVNFANRTFPTPGYTFNGLVGTNGFLGPSPAAADAVASVATATIFGTNGGPTTPLRGYRATQHEHFAQGDWCVRRDLTLNLGLRYTYFGVYSESNGAISNLYATDASGAVVPDSTPLAFGRTNNAIALIGPGRPFYQPDYNNFAPRAGLAWDMGGKNRTVLRAAYGIYYDRFFQLSYSNVANNVPYATAGTTLNLPFRLSQPIPINPRVPTIFAMDPRIRSPYTQRFTAAVEQRLGPDNSVTVAYVGARGKKLPRTDEPNLAGAFPLNLRPDTRFADQRILTNLSFSQYDAFQVFGLRRWANGFTLSVSYSFGRLLDDSSTDTIFTAVPTLINLGASAAPGFQGGTQFAPRPVAADLGYSELDLRHSFVLSHLAELPIGRGRPFLNKLHPVADAFLGGWSVAGIIVARTGATFNVTLGTDVNDDGAFDDRPALGTGALDSLYNRGGDKTQFLVAQEQASSLLVVPAKVTDPFDAIRRNSFRAPTISNYDVSLIKRFRLREGMQLGVEANAFNIFNNAKFRAPVSSLSSASSDAFREPQRNSRPGKSRWE
jgi:hypothetical protein